MTKKILLIIAVVVLILAVLAVAALFYFGKMPLPDRVRGVFGTIPLIGRETGPSGTKQELPEIPGSLLGTEQEQKQQTLLQVIEADVLSPALSLDGSSIYYVVREDGHVKKVNLEGRNEESVSNLTVLEVFEALWSPKKTKLVMRYHDSGIVKTFLNELATATPSRVMPQTITSVTWSPDGIQLAYFSRQNETTNLVTADQNHRNPKTVYSTPIPDFNLQWASKSSILLVSKPSGLAPSLVQRFDVSTRRIQTLLANSFGIIALSLADGSGFIFSETSNRGLAQELKRYKFADGSIAGLGVTTLAEKCVSDTKATKLYCGVPQSAAGFMPDDWYRGEISFNDSLIELDLKTSRIKKFDLEGMSFDIVNLFPTSDNKYIFFQDKNTGGVWRLMLKE